MYAAACSRASGSRPRSSASAPAARPPTPRGEPGKAGGEGRFVTRGDPPNTAIFARARVGVSQAKLPLPDPPQAGEAPRHTPCQCQMEFHKQPFAPGEADIAA